VPAASILGSMARSGSSDAGEGGRARPAQRSSADDPLVKEVQWRLFRREDLPARLRRLQRLEDAAFPPAGEPPGTSDASRNGQPDKSSDRPDQSL
jgi:hypothetical protein